MPGRKAGKFSVHPLFLIAGMLSAFTGQLLLFLVATLAALEHECAHMLAARRSGYALDKIVLMPYGAIVGGDLSGIPPAKEIFVCLAGPLANACTALGFVALWWLFPETYPYTDAAARISGSLFLVNLLPAWPLDGGRILRVLLRPLGETRAKRCCIAVSFVFAAGIFAFFVFSCVRAEPQFGAFAFSVMLACGCFGGGSYARMTFYRKNFSRGIEEKRIALSADRTVQESLHFLREDRYLVLVLFDGEGFAGELAEEELLSAIENGKYGVKLGELLSIPEKRLEISTVL